MATIIWVILAIIVIIAVIVGVIRLLKSGTIKESLENYSPWAYSLVNNDVFLTACLVVKGALQFMEKGGVVDTLENPTNDKIRNVTPLGPCTNVFKVFELFAKPDENGVLSERSSRYTRSELIEHYKAVFGATNMLAVLAQIIQDIADHKLYRVYQVWEKGELWNQEKTLEFIKALDILRRLLGLDRLGKNDNGEYLMFPFVPVGNMMDVYSEKFLKEFIEGHNHRVKRRRFLEASSMQLAPDKWPDVWLNSKWSEDDELLILGSDGQLRPPSDSDKKPVPATMKELKEWTNPHLAKPHERYKYLEDATHHALVQEIAECQGLADRWVYVRMRYEKFAAAFKYVMNMTSAKDAEDAAGCHFMVQLLPKELINFILYQMPLTLQEKVLLFSAKNIPTFLQENIVDKFRLGIQKEVVGFCVAKAKKVIDGFISTQATLSPETTSALTVVKQMLDEELNKLDFEALNKQRKKERDEQARKDELISRTAQAEAEREKREKLEKQQRKEKREKEEAEAKKYRPLYDADKLGERIEQTALLVSAMVPAMQQIFNPNQPAAQPGSEDKPSEKDSGKKVSDDKEEKDTSSDS